MVRRINRLDTGRGLVHFGDGVGEYSQSFDYEYDDTNMVGPSVVALHTVADIIGLYPRNHNASHQVIYFNVDLDPSETSLIRIPSLPTIVYNRHFWIAEKLGVSIHASLQYSAFLVTAPRTVHCGGRRQSRLRKKLRGRSIFGGQDARSLIFWWRRRLPELSRPLSFLLPLPTLSPPTLIPRTNAAWFPPRSTPRPWRNHWAWGDGGP